MVTVDSTWLADRSARIVKRSVLWRARGLALAAGLMAVAAACSSVTEPTTTRVATTAAATTSTSTSTPNTTTTTAAAATTTGATTSTLTATGLLVSVRPPTPEEARRFDSQNPLDCANPGAAVWDYGPISDTEPRGRLATDALADALTELNRDATNDGYEPFPLTGWTALVSEQRIDFVLIDDGAWIVSIRVGGDPDIGVWRQFSATVCPR